MSKILTLHVLIWLGFLLLVLIAVSLMPIGLVAIACGFIAIIAGVIALVCYGASFAPDCPDERIVHAVTLVLIVLSIVLSASSLSIARLITLDRLEERKSLFDYAFPSHPQSEQPQ